MTQSKLSFIHVGLPLDHPSLQKWAIANGLAPLEMQKEVNTRLQNLRKGMIAEGYGYEFVYASPEGGLENFKSQIKALAPDGVVIGGGVVDATRNPEMHFFIEQIIDAVRNSAPRSKILLIGNPEEAPAAVARWFSKR